MSKLHIGKMGMCATPDNVNAITDWIEKHPAAEKVHLYTVMGMTWNFLSDMVEAHNEFGGDAVSTGE